MSRNKYLRIIHDKCMDCSNNQIAEVKECTVKRCPLWTYRNGTDPERPKRELTPEQKKAIAERLLTSRARAEQGE